MDEKTFFISQLLFGDENATKLNNVNKKSQEVKAYLLSPLTMAATAFLLPPPDDGRYFVCQSRIIKKGRWHWNNVSLKFPRMLPSVSSSLFVIWRENKFEYNSTKITLYSPSDFRNLTQCVQTVENKLRIYPLIENTKNMSCTSQIPVRSGKVWRTKQ